MVERNQNNPGNEGSLGAETLAEAYDQNDDHANETYRGEILTVTGTIKSIDNVISAVVLRMEGLGEEYSGTHLEFKLKNRDEARSLSPGENVTVRGFCRGVSTGTGPTGEPIGWIKFDRTKII